MLSVMRLNMRNQKSKNKTWLMPVLFGVCMSLGIVWGYQLESSDHIDIGNVKMLLLFLGLSVFITLAVRYSWNKLLLRSRKEKQGITFVSGRTGKGQELKKGYTSDEFFKVWMINKELSLL